MRLKSILGTSVGCSLAYSSWVLFRPLTTKEKENWNAIYMEDSSLMLQAYRRMPLNALSRLWGRCHQMDLPKFARQPIYNSYAWLFSCNLDEAVNSDNLTKFKNLSEFFRRELVPGARPVDTDTKLVAPADGLVLHLGRVEPDGRLEQVKGVDYTLQGFLGPLCGDEDAVSASSRVPDSSYYSQLKSKGSNDLYHCVIYLSPGDYHRFHSAADWQALKRRHFPGYLMSVSPYLAAKLGGLFCLNERAIYTGHWEHGFFAYAAVGATNVGSIRIYADSDLTTNSDKPLAAYRDLHFTSDSDGLSLSKGELFGEFNLGSTIVLLFEAPGEFKFRVQAGQRVKVGEALGVL